MSKEGLDEIIDVEDYEMFNKSIKLELSSYYFTENERYIISTFDDNDVQLAVKLLNNDKGTSQSTNLETEYLHN